MRAWSSRGAGVPVATYTQTVGGPGVRVFIGEAEVTEYVLRDVTIRVPASAVRALPTASAPAAEGGGRAKP